MKNLYDVNVLDGWDYSISFFHIFIFYEYWDCFLIGGNMRIYDMG